MKASILAILFQAALFCLIPSAYAQFSSFKPIYPNFVTLSAWSDVDLDGDLDVLDAQGIWIEQDANGALYRSHIFSAEYIFDFRDMDGDGDLDAVGRDLPFNLVWCENDNSTNMWVTHFISSLQNAHSYFDVNMDGLDDIVTLDNSGNVIFIPTLGGGNFGPEEIVDWPNPSAFYDQYDLDIRRKGDIDGDGFDDLVTERCVDTPNQCYDGYYFVYQLSSMGYTEMQTSSYSYDNFLGLWDLNGDGLEEAVFSEFQTGNVYTTYDAVIGDVDTQTWVPGLTGLDYYMVVENLNNDAYPDVIGLSDELNDLLVWQGNGSGTFDAPQMLEEYTSLLFGAYSNFIDINNDGFLDLSNYNRYYLNDGTGFFSSYTEMNYLVDYNGGFFGAPWLNADTDPAVEFAGVYGTVVNMDDSGVINSVDLFGETLGTSYAWTRTARIDFNSDGIDEILVMHEDYSTVYASANGAYSIAQQVPTPVALENGFSNLAPQNVDMTGDGVEDIIGTYGNSPFNLVLIHVDPEFDITISFDFPYTETITTYPVFWDIDLDGDQDIKIWENSNEFISNNGDGTFSMASYFPLSSGNWVLQGYVDINGDGILDTWDTGGFTEYNGYGDAFYHLMPNAGPDDVAHFLDLNGDGLPEMIITPIYAFSGGFVRIYLNQGNFHFTEMYSETWDYYLNLKDPIAADVDGDGDLDILWSYSLREESSGYGWMENTGDAFRSVSGHVFVDENGDGLYSPGETGIDATPVMLLPEEILHFTDNVYYFPVTNGDYDVAVNVDEDVWIPSTPSSYAVSVSDENPHPNDINFGFEPITPEGVADGEIFASNAVCSGTQQFTFQVHNVSKGRHDVLVTVVFDPLLTYLYSSTGEYTVNGNTIQWLIEAMPYGITQTIQASVAYPDVSTSGSTLISSMSVCLLDDAGAEIVCDNEEWSQIQVCSYDPNDKQVSPVGFGDLGYIFNEETLTYTIRFQNTGNAPAQQVVLEDVLSEDLDLSTLHLISWSHPMEAEVESDRTLRFVFDNIYLPDSASDPVGSQGFVVFRLDLEEGLAAGTAIENTAAIYFDLNEAVVTNTTLNTVFDCSATDILEDIVLPCGTPNLIIDPLLDGADSYQWSVNGSVVSTDPVLNIPLGNTTNYSVVLSALLGTCTISGESTVTVETSLPAITLTFDELYTLSATYDPSYTYSWFLEDAPIFGENANTLEISQEGYYTVVAENGSGCTTQASGYFVPWSIDEFSLYGLNVFPIPADGVLNIQADQGMEELRLYDLSGALVGLIMANASSIQIEVSELSAGSYVIEVIFVDERKDQLIFTRH